MSNSNYPVDMGVKPDVTPFFDPATNTISYVVKDPASNACATFEGNSTYHFSLMSCRFSAGTP